MAEDENEAQVLDESDATQSAADTKDAQPNDTGNKFKEIIPMIVKACCDEYTAEFQYIMAEHVARGANYCDAVAEYAAHASEEHAHLLKWLKRLEQLNVQLDYDMQEFATKGNPWTPIKSTEGVDAQLGILIKAEQDAQAFYNEIIKKAQEIGDWTTERIAKELLEDECEHETDLTRISEEK